MTDSILLVGAGPMAVEYVKVLKAMGKSMTVVGRGDKSAAEFKRKTGITAISGGIDAWMNVTKQTPQQAIVCVGEKWLGEVTRKLVEFGVKEILVEKPGGLDSVDIRKVADAAEERSACIYVGYNRRFYASTQKAREIIEEDGGVSSFSFEFTEWGHVIAGLEKEEGVKEEWFLANSTHVLDHAFFLGGRPIELTCYVAGGVEWHPTASIYSGAGKTSNGALFSYNANWEAPGRWSVEILTRKSRLIFKPMEKLSIQKIGSVAIEEVPLNDELDQKFKPGLYKQVEAFLGEKKQGLLTIEEQVEFTSYYEAINKGNK